MNNSTSHIGLEDEEKDLVEQDIFHLMGISEMPDSQKEQLYDQMSETIQKRTLVKIHNQLSESDVPEFTRLINHGTPEDLLRFLSTRNIDLNNFLTQEALIYKTEMSKLAAPLRRVARQS